MGTANFEKERRLSRRAARALGQLAALLMLAGCASAAAPSSLAARTDFARERYCPLRRVAASEIEVTPPAPRAIAEDRERLAMWRGAARRRAAGTRWVEVAGCEERAVYRCYDVVVGETLRRRTRRVITGAVCLEQGLPIPQLEASVSAQ